VQNAELAVLVAEKRCEEERFNDLRGRVIKFQACQQLLENVLKYIKEVPAIPKLFGLVALDTVLWKSALLAIVSGFLSLVGVIFTNG